MWNGNEPRCARYGTPPSAPPSFAALPAVARFVHEAVMWSYERVFATAAGGCRQADARTLKGIAASAGRYTGPVRVILGESVKGYTAQTGFLTYYINMQFNLNFT